MDPELKALLDKCMTALDAGKKTQAQVNSIGDAVKQLERQVANLPGAIDAKLADMRSRSWDPRSGRYRGVFASEDDAECFGLCVLAATKDARARERLQGEMKSVYERAMGGTTAAGEGLIPIEYSARIQALTEATGVFARLAFTQPMQSDSLTFNRRTNGLTVYRVGKNEPAVGSDLGFAQVSLNAAEWAVISIWPVSMIEDSVAEIGELVAIEMATAFSQQLDTCGLVGDGTATHLDVHGVTTRLVAINGVDDGGGLVVGTGAAWSELTSDDFDKVAGQVTWYAGMNPSWVCSPAFFWRVMNPITLSAGGASRADVAGRQSLQFYGFPVELSNVMPRTEANSQVCCLFGDLRMAATHGIRKGLTIEESRHAKFFERQSVILGTQRHAVSVHTLGDATTAGPMVGLITAAS